MSISAISSGLQTLTQQNPALPANLKQFQQDFQQLGQDMNSGNLSAAKGDLSTLQQLGSSNLLNSSTPIGQQVSKLSSELQAGNLSGAEQDYANLQQSFNHVKAHFGYTGAGNSGGSDSTISTLLQQLGNEMQSTSQTNAQQTYATIQQNLLPFSTTAQNTDPSQLTGISLTA